MNNVYSEMESKEDFLNNKIEQFKYKDKNISVKIDNDDNKTYEILQYKFEKLKNE